MTNPVIEREGTVGGVTGRIVPVYRLTTGLSQKLIISAVRQALDASAAELPEVLPESLRKNTSLRRRDTRMKTFIFRRASRILSLRGAGSF